MRKNREENHDDDQRDAQLLLLLLSLFTSSRVEFSLLLLQLDWWRHHAIRLAWAAIWTFVKRKEEGDRILDFRALCVCVS